MRAIPKSALAGFATGLAVALVLAWIASGSSLSPMLIFFLWPTAIFGIGASGWQDGIFFHLFQSILVFGGNGVLYGFVALMLSKALDERKKKLKQS
jgi:hypothetical protein